MHLPNFNPFMLIQAKVIKVTKNIFSSGCSSYQYLKHCFRQLSSISNSNKKIRLLIRVSTADDLGTIMIMITEHVQDWVMTIVLHFVGSYNTCQCFFVVFYTNTTKKILTDNKYCLLYKKTKEFHKNTTYLYHQLLQN